MGTALPRRNKSLIRAVIAGVLAALVVAIPRSGTQAAGLLIADGGFGGVLRLKEHNVRVTINNGIAVTEVTQVFVNTEDRVVEALYTFPVPKGASVSNFSMIINGKEMIGEVVEKKRARQIYESYKQRRRDPGLLEQVNYKRFEMRIFPINPGAEQQVRITYYQELDWDHDWATYVYPLATVTVPGAQKQTAESFSFTLDVKSEIPITVLKSPSHGDDLVTARHGDHYLQASLEVREGSLDRDVVVAYRTERPRTGLDLIASRTPGEDGYFMLTVTAGKELEEVERGMDYVFVLDISGSMAHDGKLATSRNSLLAFIQGLSEADRFEVITFNVSPNTLFGELRPADKTAHEQAAQFLTSQRARGGTFLRPALTAAYRYRDSDRTLNVVVLSDGMTEQTEQRELLDLITNRPPGVRVFAVGVGNEVNRPLLKQLADEAGGLAAFLSADDDFQRQAKAFRRKLLRPAIENLQIEFEGGDVYDVEPQKLPDLFHGAPVRLYGRYKKPGEVAIKVTGTVLGAPLKQTVTVKLPEKDETNPQIERMWAWHRVQRLMNEARRMGDDSAVAPEIVRLCEEYSIASEYASFIVLENDQEYQRWKIARRNTSRMQRDERALELVRQELAVLQEKTLAELGPVGTPDAGSPDTPAVARNSTPSAAVQRANVVPPAPTRGADISVVPSERQGGGGAIDPVTGLAAFGLAAASALAARRRRQRKAGRDPVARHGD